MREFCKGMKASLPILTGYVPVAIAYAATAAGSGLCAPLILAMSLFVYTGAGQIAAAGMIAKGMSIASIAVTVLILNLRHIMMSTVIVEQLKEVPLYQKCLVCLGITDEVFAVYTTGKRKEKIRWLMGLAAGSWMSWNIGTILGLLLAKVIPASLLDAFGIALYAMFICLLIPGIKSHVRLLIPVLLAAALCQLFQMVLPASWAIIAASLGAAILSMPFVRMEDLE